LIRHFRLVRSNPHDLNPVAKGYAAEADELRPEGPQCGNGEFLSAIWAQFRFSKAG